MLSQQYTSKWQLEMKFVLVCCFVLVAFSLTEHRVQTSQAEGAVLLKELISKVRSISRQASEESVAQLKRARYPDTDELLTDV